MSVCWILRGILIWSTLLLVAPQDTSVLDKGLFQQYLAGCGLDGQPTCPRQPDAKMWEKTKDGQFTRVFYSKSPDLSDTASSFVDAVLESDSFVTNTCISFVGNSANNKNPRHSISFENGPVCAVEIPQNNKHRIFLNDDCVGADTTRIFRMIMLSLGFPHEINRNDRDQYILLFLENAIPGKEKEFTKDPDDMTYSQPYDLDSVLQPDYSFLASGRKPTLVAVNKMKISTSKTSLSLGDVKRIDDQICKARPAKAAVEVPVKNERTRNDAADKIQKPDQPTMEETAKPSMTSTQTAVFRTTPDIPVDNAEEPTTQRTKKPAGKIKPTLTKRCPGMVTLNNTQIMSMTTIYPEKTKFKTMSRWSKWWFHIKPDEMSKDMLDEGYDYTEFRGPVATVSIITRGSTMAKFQTEYDPQVLADGATLYRLKSETRFLECDDSDI